MKEVVLALMILAILIGNLKIKVTTKEKKYKVKLNGIVWVALDYYSIIKHKSKDEPMKPIVFNAEKNN